MTKDIISPGMKLESVSQLHGVFLENITVDLEAEAALLIEGMKNYADIPLTGPNSCQDALSSTSQVNVWDILVGVDHAGPELSCVTEKGMSYFENVTTKHGE